MSDTYWKAIVEELACYLAINFTCPFKKGHACPIGGLNTSNKECWLHWAEKQVGEDSSIKQGE